MSMEGTGNVAAAAGPRLRFEAEDTESPGCYHHRFAQSRIRVSSEGSCRLSAAPRVSSGRVGRWVWFRRLKAKLAG